MGSIPVGGTKKRGRKGPFFMDWPNALIKGKAR